MLSTSFVKGAKTRKSQTKHYLDTTLAKDTIQMHKKRSSTIIYLIQNTWLIKYIFFVTKFKTQNPTRKNVSEYRCLACRTTRTVLSF